MRGGKWEVITIKIEILPKGEYNRRFGTGDFAQWEPSNNTVSLRKSRKGLKRLKDFLHEMKHLWVDRIDNDR